LSEPRPQNKTPTLMLQGTTSNAGKSVLAAGLCRVFRNRGYRVAPFKPQNMALNSAVTPEGGEIGRSQAVQALAAGISPHTDMNPILLKPNSDKGAQVIIHGQARGNMDAVMYHGFKELAMSRVLESYERLCRQYDLIIVEGAGSPAEVNLRENDIANMGFATAVGADVWIVADIDRGGVFAHLSGTLDCLSEEEKQLVKGFVINRFRGDRSLLDSGIQWLTDKTGVTTWGILPYLPGLHIEAEDAVDRRSIINEQPSPRKSMLNVVVPKIPRISNHTDFDVLRLHPQVDLKFVEENGDIPPCDLIILPGSKNTIDDFNWLVAGGWDTKIRRHLRYGGKLIGVCGGYQMVGQIIHDPDGIEGEAGSQKGLGLMAFETVLAPVKQLKNVEGKFVGTDVSVRGYEIHAGKTTGPALSHPAIRLDGRNDGVISEDGQILCSYLHGLFDHREACNWLLDWAGLKSEVPFEYASLRDREINRVAAMLEEEVDIGALIELIGLHRHRSRWGQSAKSPGY